MAVLDPPEKKLANAPLCPEVLWLIQRHRELQLHESNLCDFYVVKNGTFLKDPDVFAH